MVRIGSVVAAAVLGALAVGAAPGEEPPGAAGLQDPFPRGPFLGNNAYRSEIRDEGAPDADDFVGPLAAGETLSVDARALPDGSGPDGSGQGEAAAPAALRPGLALLDPTGEDRTPPLLVSGAGDRVSFRRFAADVTGRWVLRVLGREDSEGPYEVRFRVEAPPGPRLRRVRLDGEGSRVEVFPFEAIRGSTLSLRLRPPGCSLLAAPGSGCPRAARQFPGDPLLDVLDPDGRPVPAVGALLDRRGGALVLRRVPLDGTDGTWRIVLGVDGAPGARPGSLAFRVDSPRRLRGTIDLDPIEPALARRDAPLASGAGTLVLLEGRGFSAAPLPTVILGGGPALVLSVDPGGRSLAVRLPLAAPDGPLDAAVVNPDGQACAAPDYVRVVPPGPPEVLALRPVPVAVTAGQEVSVTVAISSPAPVGGAPVALTLEGGFASCPAEVRVPPYGLEATFPVTAGKKPGTGRLLATYGRTVEAPVEVRPTPGPTEIDLSGWRIVQTDSSRTFVIPDGTRLRRGASLVVARNAARTAFEAFWGATLPADAVYLDSGDRFPSLNGDETFTLLDGAGQAVDGPTPKLVPGRLRRRRPGTEAGTMSSWIDLAAVPGDATPGAAEGQVGDGALRITEVADPPATGQFVHEFVEVSWDAY
jgi:hypothetical protein